MHPSSAEVHTVERRANLPHDEFVRDYCEPRRPVILTDAITHWAAASRWSPEYFAKRVGDRRVTIDGETHLVRDLADLIERSTPEAPAPYLRAQKVAELFPELVGDLEPPMVYSQPNWAYSRLLLPAMRRGRLHEILFGGDGAGFHVLHYDKSHLHAFISQLYGDKDFFVYAPDQTHRLYPKDSTPNQSPIDIFDPDLERYPDFADAQQIRLTLHPGETVFMPAGWWHTTKMSGPSISVTWNAINDTNWDDFVVDTRRRVVRRVGSLGGAAGWFAGTGFDLYANVAGRSLRALGRRSPVA